jgi:hypothetical protein
MLTVLFMLSYALSLQLHLALGLTPTSDHLVQAKLLVLPALHVVHYISAPVVRTVYFQLM